MEITESYYKEIDKDAFDEFLKGLKKDITWDCDLAIMYSSLNLIDLGIEDGWDYLKEIGIEGDLKTVKQKIKARKTNHDLKRRKNVEARDIDFYQMLAQANKLGYNVKSDILLIEWIGVLKNIRDERQNTKE